ncbi:MAG TPA: hypothetical protein VN229_25770 [Terriglobales bacterium]|nr:hypothetical protein [Terriglobales bacterium]
MAGCTATSTASLPPLPPQIETVAVYRDLPDSLLRPCDEPVWQVAEIRTDVDLMRLLSQYRLANACNSAKLKAIGRIYRGHPHGSGSEDADRVPPPLG